MSDEDTPFIDPPEQLDDDPEKNGLACFLNADRICGADCMAYTTIGSESKYLNDQQKHCVAIVGIERLGRYAGGILQLMKNTGADSKRSTRTTPPDPLRG
jgi:hypothetical protein